MPFLRKKVDGMGSFKQLDQSDVQSESTVKRFNIQSDQLYSIIGSTLDIEFAAEFVALMRPSVYIPNEHLPGRRLWVLTKGSIMGLVNGLRRIRYPFYHWGLEDAILVGRFKPRSSAFALNYVHTLSVGWEELSQFEANFPSYFRQMKTLCIWRAVGEYVLRQAKKVTTRGQAGAGHLLEDHMQLATRSGGGSQQAVAASPAPKIPKPTSVPEPGEQAPPATLDGLRAEMAQMRGLLMDIMAAIRPTLVTAQVKENAREEVPSEDVPRKVRISEVTEAAREELPRKVRCRGEEVREGQGGGSREVEVQDRRKAAARAESREMEVTCYFVNIYLKI